MNSPIVKTLPAYVYSNRDVLIAKATLGARTRKFITLQTGIKETAQVNLINTTVAFRKSSCSFDPATSQELSARKITCGHFQVDIQWCDKELLGKWAEHQVKIAADKTAEDMPFEEYFVKNLIDNINTESDKAFWQGDITSGKGNLAINDGILTLLKAAGTETDASTTNTKIAQVNLAVTKIAPAAKAQGVCRLFMSPEYFEAWLLELVAANLYHYNPGDGEDEYKIPGTKVIATSVPGLTGANFIVGGNVENLFWGADLESDNEVVDLWYSKDNQAFRGTVQFNLGAQVAFPDQVAYVKISA